MRCPACGFENASGIKFCGECGKPLGGAARPERQVSLLVKGSTDLADQVDPEERPKITDLLFAILSEGAHRFEGTVNQSTEPDAPGASGEVSER